MRLAGVLCAIAVALPPGLAGCARGVDRPDLSVEHVGLDVTVREQEIRDDVNWDPVAKDYDARMFAVYQVRCGPHDLLLSGFRPYIGYVYCDTQGMDNRTSWVRVVCLGTVQKHRYLYIAWEDSGIRFIYAASEGSIAGPLPPEEATSLLTQEGQARHTECLEPGIVYVESSFYDAVVGRGVRLDKSFRRTPFHAIGEKRE